MKTISNDFKTEIKAYGREFDDKVTYGQTTLGQDDLNSITFNYNCNLLKSQMKGLTIDSNVSIPKGTILKYEIGLKVNGNYEYIDLGNYIVKEIEQQKDTKSYLITCYDKMLYAMKDVESLNLTYPITIRNYLNAICNHLGIIFANASDTFTNYDKNVTSEHYLTYNSTKQTWESLGYTFRDILDDLAEATGSFIVINEDDELELKTFTQTNDTINEESLDEVNVTIGKNYGPINTIVLSRADVDNLYYPSTLPQNPIEIKINDNLILEQDNREDFIQGIYNNLNGLQFYLNDFNTKGILYYELGDLYNVSIDNTTYQCLMLNDEISRTSGLKEYIYTDEPQTSVTEFKYASPTDRLEQTTRNAYIKADKAEGKVEAVVSAIGDDDGNVTSASLILAINENNDSTIKLEADQLNLNGAVTANGNFHIKNDGSVEINNGDIDLTDDDPTNPQTKIQIKNLNTNDWIYLYAGGFNCINTAVGEDGTLSCNATSLMFSRGGVDYPQFISALSRNKLYIRERLSATKYKDISIDPSYYGVFLTEDENGDMTKFARLDLETLEFTKKSGDSYVETVKINGANGNIETAGTLEVGKYAKPLVVEHIESKNVFNRNTANIGYLNDDGTISSNNSWRYSDYIKIDEYATNYTISGMTTPGTNPATCFYEWDKTFISGVKNDNQSTKTITIPSGCYYIRHSYNANDSYNIQIEKGESATSHSYFQGIGYEIKNDSTDGKFVEFNTGDTFYLENPKVTTITASQDLLSDGGLVVSGPGAIGTNLTVDGTLEVKKYSKPLKVESIRTKNMIGGWFIGGLNDTTGAEVSNTNFRTDYIPVDFTKVSNYYISGLPSADYRNYVCAYNSSKQFLGRTGGNIQTTRNLNSNSFSSGTPQGTGAIKYLRVLLYTSPPESLTKTIQMEEGNSATTFSEYKGIGYVSGSNANGSYMKYDDGTLICWNRITIASVPVTTATGNMFTSANLTNFGNFPVPFIARPSLTLNSESDDNTNFWWVFKSNRQSTTEIRGFRILCPVSKTLTNASVGYIAIGRWK